MIVLGFLVTLVNIVWAAFVSSVLWGWFIVPLGAPVISMWQAMGIGLAYRCFIPPSMNDDGTDWGDYVEKLFVSFFYFTAVLLMGWLITKLAPGMAV